MDGLSPLIPPTYRNPEIPATNDLLPARIRLR